MNSRMTSLMLLLVSRFLARVAPEYSARKLKNPYFLVGCGRSGTTLLGRTLGLHAEISLYPNEANRLWHPRAYPWKHSKLSAHTPPFGFDPRRFTQLSLEGRSPLETRRIGSCFGAYQSLIGRDVFLNKSAMITFMIPYILGLFPNAKLIHIVRDGRAVALSWARKEAPKIEAGLKVCRGHGIDTSFDGLLSAFAESWKLHVQEVDLQSVQLGLKSKGTLYEIRYEDFCLDPQTYLRELADFMNASPTGFEGVDCSHIASRNYKCREELAPETFQELTRIAKPALREKGYL